MNILTQLSDEEMQQQVNQIAQHIFATASPADIYPITTYGLDIAHRLPPSAPVYLDFLRSFTALPIPGWTELNTRLKGDLEKLERLEDAIASAVYQLALEAES